MEILVILTFIVNVFAIFRYHKTLRHLIFFINDFGVLFI